MDDDVKKALDSAKTLMNKYEYEMEFHISKTTHMNYSWDNGDQDLLEGETLIIGVWVGKENVFGHSWCMTLDKLEDAIKTAISIYKINGNKRVLNPNLKYHKEGNGQQPDEEIFNQIPSFCTSEKQECNSLTFTYIFNNTTTAILNSFGAEAVEVRTHHMIRAGAVMGKGTGIRSMYARKGGLSPYNLDQITTLVQKAKQRTKEVLGATRIKPGRYTVILHPTITGLFTHEVVGHAAELDLMKKHDSVLEDKLGKKIGVDEINISDQPGAKDFGHYGVDDEGYLPKEAHIIEKGVFKEPLTSSTYAGKDNNGHGRSQTSRHIPIVRMANTYFLPGSDNTQQMIEDANDVILLAYSKGGQVNTQNGEFMFAAGKGVLLKSGEEARVFHDVGISGNLLSVLQNVIHVGNDFETSPGFCGKDGQHVPVSDGGPHIMVKDVRLM